MKSEVEPPQESQKKELSYFFGGNFAWYQYLATVVQVALYHVGVVKQVFFAGRRTSCDLRNVSRVVRAACAFATLGVPPFRIWHDFMSSCKLVSERASGGGVSSGSHLPGVISVL